MITEYVMFYLLNGFVSYQQLLLAQLTSYKEIDRFTLHAKFQVLMRCCTEVNKTVDIYGTCIIILSVNLYAGI